MAVPLVPLGELMLERNSATDPAKHPAEEFALYSIPAFDAGAPEIVTGSKIGSAKKNVVSGDILLSRIVPHIRRAWIVGSHSQKILGSGEWIVFRSNRADASYLRHFLISNPFHAQFMQTVAGVGGSLLRANPKQVANILIPLPPLPEQRRIAALLDKADALRRKRKRAIELLDSLRQSIFLEMFWDQSSPPSGAKLQPLSSVVRIVGGFAFKSDDFGDTGAPVVRISNIQDEHIDLNSAVRITPEKVSKGRNFVVKDGDLLIAMSGATTGKSGVVHAPEGMLIYLNQRVGRYDILDRKRLNQTFLHSLVRSDDYQRFLRQLAWGAAQPNVSSEQLASYVTSIPPLSDQEEFERSVARVRVSKRQLKLQLSSLESLFSSLQHRVFSGQL